MLHLNSELGLEKDYFAYMSQGISVDYAIVAPSHMSTFSPMAPLMDMPFLFRDVDHWNKVMEADALKPIADDIYKKADVRIIGYAGGGTRNLITKEPVATIDDIAQMPIRVMGAPIQTQIFEAIKMAPTVIAYDEVYNAMQTGVINAAENEAAGVEQMKFYEVGPYIDSPGTPSRCGRCASRARLSATCRRTCRRRSSKRARRRAPTAARWKSSEDQAKLEEMQKEGTPHAGRVQGAGQAAGARRAGQAHLRRGARRA